MPYENPNRSETSVREKSYNKITVGHPGGKKQQKPRKIEENDLEKLSVIRFSYVLIRFSRPARPLIKKQENHEKIVEIFAKIPPTFPL